MPYITQDRRRTLAAGELLDVFKVGDLNYMLTSLVLQYLEDNGHDYQRMNDVLGALEACKLEFYRRVVVPYEDQKIKENGDIY